MKKAILMKGPFNTRSGYGDHARSIFYALYDSDKYNIMVIDVRWGDTPRNFLQKDNTRHQQLANSFLTRPLETQPDIYIDVRIPNEFETVGKFNIGITAGIETNAISQKWIEGCNKMDLVIVPSEHSKSGVVNTAYDVMQQLPDGTQQKVGAQKVTKPVEVLFEGIDDTVFMPLKVGEIEKSFLQYINNIVPEDFAFLFVGQWVKGGYGEDRKDIGKLIKVFYETFANQKKRPALILKTSGATFSAIDRAETISKIHDIKSKFPSDWALPNVYLLHGDLSEKEMNLLYNHPKIKCMASFTHGEGFGRPLLEATMVDLPVIASGWSGQLDFLDSNYSILLSGALEQVPKSAVWKDIIIPESQWFVVNEHKAYTALTGAIKNKYEIKTRAKQLGKRNRKKYTLQEMQKLLTEIVEKYTSNLSTPVSLQLPKLKKVGTESPMQSDSSPPKIKLPKLKKII
jgi:glycosyltransferase involved in cell wall biosynthesis